MRRVLTAALVAATLCMSLAQPASATTPDRYDKVSIVTERVNGVDHVRSITEEPIGGLTGALTYSKWYTFGHKQSAGNSEYTFSVVYRHEVFFHWETVWTYSVRFHYRFSDGRNFVDQVAAHAWFDTHTTFWFPRNTPYYDNYPVGSNYIVWAQDWIDECLGGVKGIGCIKTMSEIIEVHIHDDGTGLWRFA